MMNRISRILVFLFAVGIGVSCSGVERVASFSDLPAGDKLVVRLCYASGFDPPFNYEFHFDPADGGSFEVQGESVTATNTKWTATKKPLGRVPLEKGALGKLDALLAYYRAMPKSDLVLDHAERNYVEYRQIREGAIVAEEKFVDWDRKITNDRKELLTFERILETLFPSESSSVYINSVRLGVMTFSALPVGDRLIVGYGFIPARGKPERYELTFYLIEDEKWGVDGTHILYRDDKNGKSVETRIQLGRTSLGNRDIVRLDKMLARCRAQRHPELSKMNESALRLDLKQIRSGALFATEESRNYRQDQNLDGKLEMKEFRWILKALRQPK